MLASYRSLYFNSNNGGRDLYLWRIDKVNACGGVASDTPYEAIHQSITES